jgi:uncharacterized protein YodC (DUF2158 family)
MSEELKVGDVVHLKSGSQRMTVEEIDDDGNVSCVWFEGKRPQRGVFPAATLQKAGLQSASVNVIRG